jgi:hypothetical protein
MKKLIFLMLCWRFRNTPLNVLLEEHTLLIKAARRCAHDLAHAADCIDRNGNWAEFNKIFRKNAEMWLGIFNPTGPKDYRHRLHHEIHSLEFRVERLREFCEKNGLDPNVVDDPF